MPTLVIFDRDLEYLHSLSQFVLPHKHLIDSGKINFLSSRLATAKLKGQRALLFSQFTLMLDILEVFLESEGHPYLRLDGQTPVSDRQGLIDLYNENSHILVFLLSTRAGGLGINLSSANMVLIHDIDFNPYNDRQAEDRCHRVGQRKAVEVIKLIGRGTVEEDMLECANSKLRLEKDITLSDNSVMDVTSLLRKGLGLET